MSSYYQPGQTPDSYSRLIEELDSIPIRTRGPLPKHSSHIGVVAVKDLNLKVGHAVLVVFLDGKVYLLDNQIKQVVETNTVRHYEPVFSLGTKAWWRHRK